MRLVIKWKSEGPGQAVLPPPTMLKQTNKRFHDRLPVKYRFTILVDTIREGQRCIQARGINMSKSGALVETTEPLRISSQVYIRALGLGLMGAACVRHCTVKGSKYRIGLHFPGPLTRSL